MQSIRADAAQNGVQEKGEIRVEGVEEDRDIRSHSVLVPSRLLDPFYIRVNQMDDNKLILSLFQASMRDSERRRRNR